MFHICAKVRQGSGISLTQDFVPGGVDFSQVPKLHFCQEIKHFQMVISSVKAQEQPDGRMCVVKEEQVDSLEREQVTQSRSRFSCKGPAAQLTFHLVNICFQKMSYKSFTVNSNRSSLRYHAPLT